ncbi:MAG: hypothetical protein GY803_20175 [Chloroflexi bacterium]|nr:hypothetical protein [Chloroflexota bacterium]
MTEQTMTLRATAVNLNQAYDLDQLRPGEPFELMWAFRNDGETAWDDAILAYTDESFPDTTDYPHTNFAAQTQFGLAELGAADSVAPGAMVYLTLRMTAPDAPGVYLTGWQLQTAVGDRFGPMREMRIIVAPPTTKALGELTYEVVDFSNSDPNYNDMQAGKPFTGTWILKNNGIDSWSGDFKIVASPGAVADTYDARFDLMGLAEFNTLRDLSGQNVVPPNATVTIRMSFTTPDAPGIYALHWQLCDAEGRPFGGIRWMRIVVTRIADSAPTDPVTPEPVEYEYGGTAVAFFTGIHGPADDWMWGDGRFQKMMRDLDMPVFFWSHGANGDHAGFGDKTKNAVRLYWNPRPVSADEAYEEVRDDQLKNWWNRGYRRFIFFNEPQFGKEIAKIEEGMGISWHGKEQFARFLAQCLRRAKQDFPGIQLFTTPMSSNEAFDPWGWRDQMWRHTKDLIDGWCMHAYSGDNVNADAAAQNIADQVIALQRRYQLQIPIIISEASVNRGNDAEQKARVAHLLHRKLSQVPGVEGVFWYAADWNPDLDKHHEGWFRNGIADAYLRQRGAA